MDAKVRQALTHPLRAELLDRLTTEEASPRQLAEALGTGVSRVAYHVAVLRKAGLVKGAATTGSGGQDTIEVDRA